MHIFYHDRYAYMSRDKICCPWFALRRNYNIPPTDLHILRSTFIVLFTVPTRMYVYMCSAGRVASSDICVVRGCYGVSLVVRGVSRSFSGVSEPGDVLGVVGFKL